MLKKLYYRDGGTYIDGQLRTLQCFDIVVFRFVALTNYENRGYLIQWKYDRVYGIIF